MIYDYSSQQIRQRKKKASSYKKNQNTSSKEDDYESFDLQLSPGSKCTVNKDKVKSYISEGSEFAFSLGYTNNSEEYLEHLSDVIYGALTHVQVNQQKNANLLHDKNIIQKNPPPPFIDNIDKTS